MLLDSFFLYFEIIVTKYNCVNLYSVVVIFIIRLNVPLKVIYFVFFLYCCEIVLEVQTNIKRTT